MHPQSLASDGLWLHLTQVLAKLPWLRSLNMRGCPLASSPGYPGCVLRLLPSLEVLDSKRVGVRGLQGGQQQQGSAGTAVGPDKADRAAAASTCAAQAPGEQRPKHAGGAAAGVEPGEASCADAGPHGQPASLGERAAAQEQGSRAKPKAKKRRHALQGEQHLSAGEAAPVHKGGSAAAAPEALEELPQQPRPAVPVIGVFEAAKKPAAAEKEIATGAKAALLLASGLESGLGGWDAPLPAAASAAHMDGGVKKRRKKG